MADLLEIVCANQIVSDTFNQPGVFSFSKTAKLILRTLSIALQLFFMTPWHQFFNQHEQHFNWVKIRNFDAFLSFASGDLLFSMLLLLVALAHGKSVSVFRNWYFQWQSTEIQFTIFNKPFGFHHFIFCRDDKLCVRGWMCELSLSRSRNVIQNSNFSNSPIYLQKRGAQRIR